MKLDRQHAAFSDLVFVHSPTYHHDAEKRKPYVEIGRTGRRWRNRVLSVLIRDRFTCVSCGANHDLTVDHIYPKSKGGGDGPENLQTMCWRCNGEKGNTI